jgi:diadenylate cyclase
MMLLDFKLPAFLHFGWLDFIDVLLVALLLFQLYRIVRGSVAINIFIGILSVYFLWLIMRALKMQLLSTILGQFIGVGVIAIIIVFQQELRRFLLLIGTSGFLGKGAWRKAFKTINDETKSGKLDVLAIVRACKNMSTTNTGAIIIIQNKTDLSFYINTGDNIDAQVNMRLIESIFYKNSPLHDGAVIISNNEIKAARCVLPISDNPELPNDIGMRHRAAAGITESTDALAIIVSEQTGKISIARNGILSLDINGDELKSQLENVRI